MTDYSKSVNFAVKDTLTSGDPNKIVSGAEIDTEFNNIASASTTKANRAANPTQNNVASLTSLGHLKDTGRPDSSLIPAGGIIMWSGSIGGIPTGWALCDGNNGTPDLRDRFVVGAGDSYSVGGTGGNKDAIVVDHTHTMNSAGSHSHSGTASTTNIRGSVDFNGMRPDIGTDMFVNASGVFGKDEGGGASSSNSIERNTGDVNRDVLEFNADHSHSLSINSAGSHSHTINSTGSSATDANLPPYLALAYIMKL